MLTSGGRDSAICNLDVRKRRDEACVAKVISHEQVSWSEGGSAGLDFIWVGGCQLDIDPFYLISCLCVAFFSRKSAALSGHIVEDSWQGMK